MFHYCLFLSRSKLIRIRSEGAVEVGVVSAGAAATAAAAEVIAAEAEGVSAAGAARTIEIRSTIEAADAADSGAVLEAAAADLGRVSTEATKAGTGSGNRSAVIAGGAVILTVPETLIAVETVLDRSRRKTRKLSSTNRFNLRVPGEYFFRYIFRHLATPQTT